MTQNSQQNTNQNSLSQDFAIGLATGFNSSVINTIFKSGLPGTSALMLGDVAFSVAVNNITGSELGKAFIQVGVGLLIPDKLAIIAGAPVSIAVGELYDKAGEFIQSSFEKYYLDKKYGTIEQIRAEYQKPTVVFKGDNGGLFKIENGKYVEVDSSSIPNNNNSQNVVISKSSSTIKNNDLEIKITDKSTSITSNSLNQNELLNSSKTLLDSQKAGSEIKIESTDGDINTSLLSKSLLNAAEKILADDINLESKIITIRNSDGTESFNLAKSDEELIFKDGTTATFSSFAKMTQAATEVTEKFINGYMNEAKALFTTGEGIASLISDVAAGLEKGLEPEQIAKIVATKLVVKTAMSQIKNEFILSESDQALLDQGTDISELSPEGQQALSNFAVNHPFYNTAYLAAVSFATTILLHANDGMNSEEYTAAAIEATAQAAAQTAISVAISKGWLNMSSSAGAGVGAAAGYIISASIRDLFADDHMNSHQWQSTFASAGVLGVAAYAGAAAGSAIATAMSLGAFAGPIGIVGAVIATIIVSQFMGGKEYGPGEYPDPSQIIAELYQITSKADGSGLEIFGVGKEGVTLKASQYGVDDIYGSRHSDVLVGNDQNNIIVGSSGNDNGVDNDMIEGKGGDDILLGKEGHDHIDGGDGNDQIDGGTGNDRLIGGNGNDAIIGDDGDDLIDGGNGDDQIDSGAGDDTIFAGNGSDVIISGTGDDQIESGEGDDIIFSENGNDLIKSGSGDDQIDSGDGDDEIYGQDGNDSITSGLGNDIVFAGNGVDIVNSGLGNDIVDSGNGNDLVLAGTGNDIVYGNDGNDELYGELGNDYLMGGIGDDKIVGGDGDDILDGNKGDDTLEGGSGNDFYVHTLGDGNTTITDESGSDTLRIFGIADDKNLSFVQNGNDLEVRLTDATSDKIVIKDQFASTSNKVETLRIDNGIEINLSSLNISSGTANYIKSTYDDRFDVSKITEEYQNALKDSDQEVIYNSSSSWYQNNYDINVLNEKIDYTKYNDVQIRSYKAKRNIFGGYYNVYYKYYEKNLGGTFGNDKIVGSWWSENIWGGSGNDYLYGNDGNDNIFGGNDSDLIYLGSGNDNGYGDNGTDKIYGGEGNDNVEGNNDNDTLYGEAGNDVIMGRSGDDLMFGGKGNDFLKGGEGNDIVFGGDNSDNIDGNQGNDYLLGENGDDIISGGAGDDTLVGGSGNDILNGNEGNDLLKGGIGLDIIDGGDGDDQISAGDDNDMIIDSKGNDQISLGNGKDILVINTANGGIKVISDFNKNEDRIVLKDITTNFSSLAIANIFQEGNDVRFSYNNYNLILKNTLKSDLNPNNFITSIIGNELDNILNGDDYANAIFGLDGNDILNGNGGDDLLWGGNGTDQLYGNAGNDILYYNIDSYWKGSRQIAGKWDITNRTPSTLNSNNGDIADLTGNTASKDLFDGGDGDDILIMSEQNDTILLDSALNQISKFNKISYENNNENGFGGALIDIETIYAFGGDDIINLSSNTNVYGDIRVYGDSGNDTIWTNQGNDILFGGDGNDKINSGAGNDLIYGGYDDDTIDGWSGNDIIYGDEGNDDIMANEGDDTVYGGDGNDKIRGWFGNDTLIGNDGNDTLWGEGDNDTILGGDGNDTLYGQAGDDILHGGKGNDVLFGGETGNDTYLFNKGDGKDIFQDINHTGQDNGAMNDVIKLGAGIGVDDLMLSRSGTDLIINFRNNPDDSITVKYQFYYENNTTDKQYHRIEYIKFADSSLVVDLTKLKFAADNNTSIWSGTSGNDIMTGVGDADVLIGGAGNDTLNGGSGNDTLWGEGDNDILYGNDGDDMLYGQMGDDTLYGSKGNDNLFGGETGNDTYVFNKGDGNDIFQDINHMGQDDGALNDQIILGSGITANDLTLRRNGTDLIINFKNNPTDSITVKYQFYYENNANDKQYHRIEYIKFTDSAIALDLTTLSFGSDGVANWKGNSLNNTINGTAASDLIIGGSGNDTLIGNAGNDTLWGENDNDTLYGGDGDDTLHGQMGDDILQGGKGNDNLFGGETGNDTYIFNKGDGKDTFQDINHFGYDDGALNDKIVLGAGIKADDLLFKRNGADLLISFKNNPDDSITVKYQYYYENNTNDKQYHRIEYLKFTDNDLTIDLTTLKFAADNDTSIWNGNSSNNVLTGVGDSDTLIGGAGNDILHGGGGKDILNGGSGSDSFDFSSLQDSSTNSMDLIEDFEQGSDKINLFGFDHISFDALQFTFENGHTIVKDHNSDFAIDLKGHYDLVQNDFVFKA